MKGTYIIGIAAAIVYVVTHIMYLAGFFDGEGYISSLQNGAWRSIVCGAAQIDPRPLQLLHTRYGGSLLLNQAQKYNPRARPCWVYVARAQKARALLAELSPHLIVKRGEAMAALAYQESLTNGRQGHQLTEQEASTRNKLLDNWDEVRDNARTAYSIKEAGVIALLSMI